MNQCVYLIDRAVLKTYIEFPKGPRKTAVLTVSDSNFSLNNDSVSIK